MEITCICGNGEFKQFGNDLVFKQYKCTKCGYELLEVPMLYSKVIKQDDGTELIQLQIKSPPITNEGLFTITTRRHPLSFPHFNSGTIGSAKLPSFAV